LSAGGQDLKMHPCKIVGVMMLCFHYDGLRLMKDVYLTRNIEELEIQGLNWSRMKINGKVEYDMNKWPKLRKLWLDSTEHDCWDGICRSTPNDGANDEADGTNDEANDGRNDLFDGLEKYIKKGGPVLTDVGILLMTIAAIIVLVVLVMIGRIKIPELVEYIRRRRNARNDRMNLELNEFNDGNNDRRVDEREVRRLAVEREAERRAAEREAREVRRLAAEQESQRLAAEREAQRLADKAQSGGSGIDNGNDRELRPRHN
jgi:hypothetical protein